MKCLHAHLPQIAYLLVMLILFQSCIVYQSTIYTPKEASDFENTHIKLKTIDGENYKLPWIKEVDGNILSIRNTKKENIKRDMIKAIIINNSQYFTTFDEPINYEGDILVVTRNPKHPKKLYNHSFFRIEDNMQYIKGYSLINKDTATVMVPIDQIASIKVEDRTGSGVASFAITIGTFMALGTILIAIYTINGNGFL